MKKYEENEYVIDTVYDFMITSSDGTVKFNIKKNSDGTANLFGAVDEYLAEGTDIYIYMQIILDANTPTESILGELSLKEYIKSDTGYDEKLEDKEILGHNEYFTFENGKFILIDFPSV